MTISANPIRILYMEDDPGLARLTQRRLGHQGYIVEIARNGQEGIDMYQRAQAKNTPYDILAIDQAMPIYDGLQVMRRLRQQDKLPPVIMITGAGNESVAIEAMKLGAKDYIVKDIDAQYLDLLPAVIEQVIDSERLKTIVASQTKELKDTRNKLVRQEKLAVLGELARSVGEELRDPLSVIANAVYFLRIKLNAHTDSTTQEYLDIIDARVQTAEHILANLRNLSLIRPAQPESIAITTLITNVLIQAPERENIHIIKYLPPHLPPVFVDKIQTQHALYNLIINAYEAITEQGCLTIQATSHNNMLTLSIQDNGRGMSDIVRMQIFEPLFTTKEKGIGLGLTVSKSLIEINGGQIEVESQENKGSTFIITFPITLSSRKL